MIMSAIESRLTLEILIDVILLLALEMIDVNQHLIFVINYTAIET